MQRIRFHRQASTRRGAALVIALIALLLVGVLGAQLARSAILQHEQVRHEEWQIQAEWLAESALDRAAATLKSNPDYQGEVWQATAGPNQAAIGQVVIEIEETDEEGLTIRAVADVPDSGEHRARVSRERRLPGNGNATGEVD